MPKLRVVEARICSGSGGFGGGVEPLVGFGLAFGVSGFLGVGCALRDYGSSKMKRIVYDLRLRLGTAVAASTTA